MLHFQLEKQRQKLSFNGSVDGCLGCCNNNKTAELIGFMMEIGGGWGVFK